MRFSRWFLLFACLGVTTAASPTRAQVIDPQSSGGCVWDGTHDVARCIQLAINTAAKTGGVVHVAAGTWPIGRALTLAGGITLAGDAAGTTLVPTDGNISQPVLMSGAAISGTLVENMIFDGGGQDFSNTAPLITVTTGTGIVFESITVQNSRGMGLIIQGNSRNSGVRHSLFSNLGNHWQTTMNAADRAQGLVFCCGSGNMSNFALGNTFQNIGLDALQISDQQDFRAAHNSFNLEMRQTRLLASNNFPAGIFSTLSQNVQIFDNTIMDAPGNGIDAPGMQDSMIENNIISGCGYAGIGLFLGYDNVTQITGMTITGNTINNNVQYRASPFRGGITVSGGHPSDISIAGNTITDTQPRKTQDYGVQVPAPTVVTSLDITSSNNLTGNRIAPVFGH